MAKTKKEPTSGGGLPSDGLASAAMKSARASKAALTNEAMSVLASLDGVTTQVTITAANGIKYQGNLRPAGQPTPLVRVPGPTWKFGLPNGSYIFNVNIAAVGGVKVTFTVTGATATSATDITMPSPNGAVTALNTQIGFTVP